MTDELSAALKAISKALDGPLDPDTVFGCQVILEYLAEGSHTPAPA